MQVISITGRRQTGKTERVVWLAAGAIISGARPLIPAKTVTDGELIRGRLASALRTCGLSDHDAHRRAGEVVSVLDVPTRGGSFVIREVDLD